MALEPLAMLALLAQRVEDATPTGHPTRVAIDGPDCAGKTTLANDLADRLAPARPVIRPSLHHVHRPSSERRRRGDLSAEGYYLDSFDNSVIVDEVLKPLGPGGDRCYRSASFDHRTDSRLDPPKAVALQDAVVLLDGVFLLRPELRELWDLSIYLDVPPEESIRRARARDLDLFGSMEALDSRYRTRYLPGQAFYRAAAAPLEHADI